MRSREKLAGILRNIAAWIDDGPILEIWPVDDRRTAMRGSLSGTLIVHGGIVSPELFIGAKATLLIPLVDLKVPK